MSENLIGYAERVGVDHCKQVLLTACSDVRLLNCIVTEVDQSVFEDGTPVGPALTAAEAEELLNGSERQPTTASELRRLSARVKLRLIANKEQRSA